MEYSTEKKYYKIIERSDRVVKVSPKYTSNCMFARNRYLVDNSGYLICYLRDQRGGTFYTVNYARTQGLKILEL